VQLLLALFYARLNPNERDRPRVHSRHCPLRCCTENSVLLDASAIDFVTALRSWTPIRVNAFASPGQRAYASIKAPHVLTDVPASGSRRPILPRMAGGRRAYLRGARFGEANTPALGRDSHLRRRSAWWIVASIAAAAEEHSLGQISRKRSAA